MPVFKLFSFQKLTQRKVFVILIIGVIVTSLVALLLFEVTEGKYFAPKKENPVPTPYKVPVSTSSAIPAASTPAFLFNSNKLSAAYWRIYQNPTYNYSIEVPSGDLGKFYKTKEYSLPEVTQKVGKGVPVVDILEIRRDYYDGINKDSYDWEFGDLEITKETMEAAIERTKSQYEPQYEVFISDENYTLAGTKVKELIAHQLSPASTSPERIDYLTYEYFAEKTPYTYHLHGFNSAIFRRIYDSFQLK